MTRNKWKERIGREDDRGKGRERLKHILLMGNCVATIGTS